MIIGFWGKCFNDYQDVKPHEGYDLLLKIKKSLFDQKKKYSYTTEGGKETEIELNQAFVYTRYAIWIYFIGSKSFYFQQRRWIFP